MMRRSLLVVLLACGAITAVRASTFISAEFKEVVSESALIVSGRVTDVRGVRRPDGGVDSVATVAVASVLKGDAGAYVSVWLPGGQVGRFRQVMVGAPSLKVGEHAVLFLKRSTGNTLWPVGLSSGIFRVSAEPRTGAPMVAAAVIPGRTTAESGPVIRGDLRRQPLPLSEFESLVRLVLASQKKGARP